MFRPGNLGHLGRLGLVAASRPGLVAQALAILAKYGSAANLYLPGVGAINGITAGNWLDTVGGTPATVDGAVGLVVNSRGGANLTQPTTANKPILRLAGGVYAWQFDGSNDSFTSTLGTGNAGYFCTMANVSDTGSTRSIISNGAIGANFPGVWLVQVGDNVYFFVGNGTIRNNVLAAFPSATNTIISAGWDAGSLFLGIANTETSAAKTVDCTLATGLLVGAAPGASTPWLGTIGATIIMPTALPTATERATLRQFIASLSGVTL